MFARRLRLLFGMVTLPVCAAITIDGAFSEAYGDKEMYFDPAQDKVYRHPSFYQLPQAVNHM